MKQFPSRKILSLIPPPSRNLSSRIVLDFSTILLKLFGKLTILDSRIHRLSKTSKKKSSGSQQSDQENSNIKSK